MTRQELQRARWVVQEVARDAERDVLAFDGRPFNGRTVAEYFGVMGAQVMALAMVLDQLIVHSVPYPVEPAEHP